jgi:octaprenyl-diphosphate synthase
LSTPDSSSSKAFSGLIGMDMLSVDGLINSRLSSGVPLVGQVAEHIIMAGGKRLRPVLLLLMAGALGYKGTDHHKLAAVIEFIHTATLLHDDVVDDSNLRRGRPTANAMFGNPASVLVGDFLYSRAFQMMVECQNLRILDIVAEATNVIAEGEVMQLMNMHDASLDVDAYLRVIRSKTAKLFEASTRLPAVLTQSSAAVESACAQYGQALGTAFQVIDDVLDYDGDAALMGKNLGDDLREGKATLPLIVAMQRGNPAQCALVKHAIEQGDVAGFGRYCAHRAGNRCHASHSGSGLCRGAIGLECVAGTAGQSLQRGAERCGVSTFKSSNLNLVPGQQVWALAAF